jgi:hypothetical protein
MELLILGLRCPLEEANNTSGIEYSQDAKLYDAKYYTPHLLLGGATTRHAKKLRSVGGILHRLYYIF